MRLFWAWASFAEDFARFVSGQRPLRPPTRAPRGHEGSGGGSGSVRFTPFETSPPDSADRPPIVRMAENEFGSQSVLQPFFETGSAMILRWSAQDEGGIAEQRILFSQAGNLDASFQSVAVLAPGRRSFQWSVPDVPFIVSGRSSWLRVQAIDTPGQVGWDEIPLSIPSGALQGQVTITSSFGGMSFRSGAKPPPITWTLSGGLGGTPSLFILLDPGERSVSPGSGGSGGWTFTKSPHVSTDTARIAIRRQASLNDFARVSGEPFSLRPDPGIADAPPSVQLPPPRRLLLRRGIPGPDPLERLGRRAAALLRRPGLLRSRPHLARHRPRPLRLGPRPRLAPAPVEQGP